MMRSYSTSGNPDDISPTFEKHKSIDDCSECFKIHIFRFVPCQSESYPHPEAKERMQKEYSRYAMKPQSLGCPITYHLEAGSPSSRCGWTV